MKLQIQGDTLRISEVRELGVGSSSDFHQQARAALTTAQKNIEIDLSQTMLLDSCGMGTLISLRKTTAQRSGAVRLLNPNPSIQQILEFARMHHIFEIVKD